ncbi:protein translocase subunit SecF, partial [Alphaproteobacteria bacterium]|nr:protein translocase subunit SecF [Alphaproteobacteria bacterium]
GSSQDILIRSSVNDIELNQAVKLIKNTIMKQVLEFRRVEIVGPVIGEELKKHAFYAVVFALLAMMLYLVY